MLDAGVADWGSLSCLRGRIPRSPSVLGLVIDDLVLLERVVRGARSGLRGQRFGAASLTVGVIQLRLVSVSLLEVFAGS